MLWAAALHHPICSPRFTFRMTEWHPAQTPPQAWSRTAWLQAAAQPRWAVQELPRQAPWTGTARVGRWAAQELPRQGTWTGATRVARWTQPRAEPSIGSIRIPPPTGVLSKARSAEERAAQRADAHWAPPSEYRQQRVARPVVEPPPQIRIPPPTGVVSKARSAEDRAMERAKARWAPPPDSAARAAAAVAEAAARAAAAAKEAARPIVKPQMRTTRSAEERAAQRASTATTTPPLEEPSAEPLPARRAARPGASRIVRSAEGRAAHRARQVEPREAARAPAASGAATPAAAAGQKLAAPVATSTSVALWASAGTGGRMPDEEAVKRALHALGKVEALSWGQAAVELSKAAAAAEEVAELAEEGERGDNDARLSLLKREAAWLVKVGAAPASSQADGRWALSVAKEDAVSTMEAWLAKLDAEVPTWGRAEAALRQAAADAAEMASATERCIDTDAT